ncbi:MAG: hypothetical protein M1831_001408 [Alyxoria varia]|nr:MAG: hypothetical protein M1831_001408 [Alyxoria varia]
MSDFDESKKYTAKEEVYFDDGREIELLNTIYNRPDIDALRNNPHAVLSAIDDYAHTTKYLMNVGPAKGRIVCDLIRDVRPRTMLELGGYVGYSSILFGDAMRKASAAAPDASASASAGGATCRYYSLERSPEFAAVVMALVDLAGLSDIVKVVVGPSDAGIRRLHAEHKLDAGIDLMFLDHYKPGYVADLKLCEDLRLITPGRSVLAADNVIEPGNPPYLEYVRASIREKKGWLEERRDSGGVDERFEKRTTHQYVKDGDLKTVDGSALGDPKLVYESRLVESWEPTGVKLIFIAPPCRLVSEFKLGGPKIPDYKVNHSKSLVKTALPNSRATLNGFTATAALRKNFASFLFAMNAWEYTTAKAPLEKYMRIVTNAQKPPSDPLPPNKNLIRVTHAALNPVDYKLAELPAIGGFIGKAPATPGLDFAGRVEKLGPGQDKTGLQVGQKVFGRLEGPAKFGTLAQYTVVSAEGTAPLPDGIDPSHAAAVGTAGMTAYQCLQPFLKERLAKTDAEKPRVFINGGSGGTGTFGIQIAKALGCHVTTTCSTANVELCRSLGADEVIDYKSQDVVQTLTEKGQTQKFDHVVDNVGSPAELYKASDNFVSPQGKYTQVGADMSLSAMGGMAGRFIRPGFLGGGKTPFQFVQCKSSRQDFTQIAQWMQEGKVKAILEPEKFGWNDVPKAYEKVKSGRTKGKIVIEVPDDS